MWVGETGIGKQGMSHFECQKSGSGDKVLIGLILPQHVCFALSMGVLLH